MPYPLDSPSRFVSMFSLPHIHYIAVQNCCRGKKVLKIPAIRFNHHAYYTCTPVYSRRIFVYNYEQVLPSSATTGTNYKKLQIN